MIYKVQEGLNRSFPEFKEQKMLIDYYVSFEFPDKQRKMVAWWEAVIIEALKISGQLYLSPAQL